MVRTTRNPFKICLPLWLDRLSFLPPLGLVRASLLFKPSEKCSFELALCDRAVTDVSCSFDMLCDVGSYGRVAKFLFVVRCEFEPWQLGFFSCFPTSIILPCLLFTVLTTVDSWQLEPRVNSNQKRFPLDFLHTLNIILPLVTQTLDNSSITRTSR